MREMKENEAFKKLISTSCATADVLLMLIDDLITVIGINEATRLMSIIRDALKEGETE